MKDIILGFEQNLFLPKEQKKGKGRQLEILLCKSKPASI